MKKNISPIFMAVLLILFFGGLAQADYKELKGRSGTEVEFWFGGVFTDVDTSKNDGYAEFYIPPLTEAATRVGTNRAAEYEALDNSPSGGFLIVGTPQPQRYHLEFDYFSDNDWFGDFRYSYLDYFQARLLSRRFYHNLDNLTLFNYGTTAIDIKDVGIDDYGIRMEIDQFKMRLKTPNFPLHLYTNGEVVSKKGNRQQRFLGGNAFFTNRVRVSESRELDQQKNEISFGTNAHLGLVSMEFFHMNRVFESDAAAPIYSYDNFTGVHNLTPKLKANRNTFKMHTTHSGRLFAALTYQDLEKTNEYSGAEADNTLSYGEVFWRPMTYFSLSTKYRHLAKDASVTSAKVAQTTFTGAINQLDTVPGVKSTTDTAILAMKYSQIPSTNLHVQYTNKIKEVDDDSAIEWGVPFKTTKNIYQVGITNWAIPKVRITGKYVRTNTDNDFYIDLTGATTSSVNNDPEHVDRGILGLTWLISPKIAAFINADVTRSDTGDNRQVGIPNEYLEAESLNQIYLTSLNFIVSDKLAITPTYTYFSYAQDRDILWEDNNGDHVVDSDYSNEQKAHCFAVNIMYVPTKKITMNGTVDYTKTDGSYDPTSPFTVDAAGSLTTADIAQFSESSTQEINLSLDTEYELSHGWGVGLDLRYTDWQDDSFDNPADGTFIGGLFKITKKMSIR